MLVCSHESTRIALMRETSNASTIPQPGACVGGLPHRRSDRAGRAAPTPSPCMASRRCRPTSTHFPYVNPDAPKGGRDRLCRGRAPSTASTRSSCRATARAACSTRPSAYNVFDTLMLRSRDEPFTLYPLLAETVETDEERSFVEFTLDAAREILGRPAGHAGRRDLHDGAVPRQGPAALRRTGCKIVDRMEKVGERGVRFTFNDRADRELPLILGLLPDPAQARDRRRDLRQVDAEAADRQRPLPVDDVKPGDSVTLQAQPGLLGQGHSLEARLRQLRRDPHQLLSATRTRMFEAFKKGSSTSIVESDTGRWESGYDFPAVDATAASSRKPSSAGLPSGMFGFVLNTRRDVFKDRGRARRAGQPVRLRMGQPEPVFRRLHAHHELFRRFRPRPRTGVPASAEEKALLAPFPDAVHAGDHGRHLDAAEIGRQRPRPRVPASSGFDALKAAGYTLAGRQAARPDGQAARFRDPAQRQRSGRLAHRLAADAGEARHRA